MTDTPRLVGFGHLTLERIVREKGGPRAENVGGTALYAALAARLFEARTQIVAPLEQDFPQRLRRILAAHGFAADNFPTRVRTADVVDLAPKPADVPRHFWGADAFLVMAMPWSSQAELIGACGVKGGATCGVVVRKKYIVGKKRACLAMLPRIDVLVTGLAEAAYLLGTADPAAAVLRAAGLGPSIVAIDLGARAYLIHDRASNMTFTQAPYPAQPISAAGGAEAFAGAFMACLIQPAAKVKWAAAAAAVAASFAVSAPGADGALAAGPLDAARRLALFVRPPAASSRT